MKMPRSFQSFSLIFFLANAFPAAAYAQGAVDPLLADQATDAWEADDAASRWYGDLALRGESTRGFSNRDDIERLRSRLRLGWRHDGETLSLRVAAKLGLGSDDNRDNRRNLDNEESNGAGLDDALLTWHANERIDVHFGKTAFPLATTPLVWDSDLRPLGASLAASWPVADFDRISLVAGYFAGQHLYGDDSRIGAMQLGWHYHEGAPFSAETLLAYIDFNDLERAAQEGLTRSNRRIGQRLLSDYRLLDWQGALRWQLGERPLSARLDLVYNLGADDENRGARFSLVLGDAQRQQGLELAVALQRFQRDAVSAAFSADDWWFHSAARGVMPWIAYGLTPTWSVQLSGFHERMDGRDEYINRVLLDVRARW